MPTPVETRRAAILENLKAGAAIPKSTPPDIEKLKITQHISPSNLAKIDNLLGSINGTSIAINKAIDSSTLVTFSTPTEQQITSPFISHPLQSELDTSSNSIDLSAATVFYTTFGGGTIYMDDKTVISLPFTTSDPIAITAIRAKYSIGSLTCPIKMKVLG